MKLFIIIIIALLGIAFDVYFNRKFKKFDRKFEKKAKLFDQFSKSTQEKVQGIISNELTDLNNEVEKLSSNPINILTASKYVELDDRIIYSKKKVKRYYDPFRDTILKYTDEESTFLAEGSVDVHSKDLGELLKKKRETLDKKDEGKLVHFMQKVS